jgi:hypothetical protein
VIWVDQVLPRYSRKAFTREAVIGLSIEIDRRCREINVFRRNDREKDDK